MSEDANLGILDRPLFHEFICQNFSAQTALLEQLVNYGTNLVPRCFVSSDRGIPETVVILCFLKHAVTSLDAIEILSKEGATLACYPHMRSIFEINFYTKWIFKSNYENRAKAYFVWNLRRQRYWNRCYLPGTPEYAAHQGHMAGSPGENLVTPFTEDQLRTAIALDDSKLNLPEVSAINAMFDQRVSSSGKDVEWYKPFGPSSLRGMAQDLGEEGVYKAFYPRYSEYTHGLSIGHQIAPGGDGTVVFEHIRTLQDIDQVFRLTFNEILALYRRMLERYRPGELALFSQKYINNWRDAYHAIPKVNKSGSTFTVQQTAVPPPPT